jgi:murein DD-endopeptidase MepM/ murein hydrolase activator NlpD
MNIAYIEPFAKNLRGDELGNLAPYRNGRPHRGQDWHPAELTPIPAISTGKVTGNFWTDVLGWCLVHRTADSLFVLYAHLAEQSPLAVGDVVRMGDTIGRVGGGKHKSGTASTGAHLHLALATSKNPHLCPFESLVNPLTHIAKYPAPKAASKPAVKAPAKPKATK